MTEAKQTTETPKEDETVQFASAGAKRREPRAGERRTDAEQDEWLRKLLAGE